MVYMNAFAASPSLRSLAAFSNLHALGKRGRHNNERQGRKEPGTLCALAFTDCSV